MIVVLESAFDDEDDDDEKDDALSLVSSSFFSTFDSSLPFDDDDEKDDSFKALFIVISPCTKSRSNPTRACFLLCREDVVVSFFSFSFAPNLSIPFARGTGTFGREGIVAARRKEVEEEEEVNPPPSESRPKTQNAKKKTKKKSTHHAYVASFSLTLTAHDDLRDTALCAAALLSGIKPEADKVQAILLYV